MFVDEFMTMKKLGDQLDARISGFTITDTDDSIIITNIEHRSSVIFSKSAVREGTLTTEHMLKLYIDKYHSDNKEQISGLRATLTRLNNER